MNMCRANRSSNRYLNHPRKRSRKIKRTPLWLTAIATLILFTAIVPAYSSEFILRTVEEDQKSPAIAYNSKADEFLVVWDDYVWKAIGTLGIAAQRTGAHGNLIGESFAVVGEWFTFRPFTNPDLVYNPSSNEYLLVWQYGQSSDDHHIYAIRLSSNGAAIGDDHIHVADTSQFESNPQVAYNPTDNEYLIVWEHRNVQTITTGSGTIDIIENDIYGQRLSAAGSLLGGPIEISATSLDQSAPSVAFGTTNGSYLVVWQETLSTGETDIYGQRIGLTGTLLGGKIAVSTYVYDQIKPSLAYNNKTNEFLVVWEDHQGNFGEDRDILGQRVTAGGIPQGGNFLISWEGDDLCYSPDVAYNPGIDEYLVTWKHEIYSGSAHYDLVSSQIYQRRLSSSGALIGDEAIVSSQSVSQSNPTIAPSDTSYLIVWEDGRNARTMGIDLYGAVIALDMLTGHVYEGYTGDESSPLSNVALDLYCSNNADQLGSLLTNTVTDSTGSYTIMLNNVCEYYNIIETDPTGYISTGASSAGRVINDNWIELTYPLSASEMSDNDFWDISESPPGNWTTFSPTDWVTNQTVTCSVTVEDTGSGLDVSTAQYAYYQNTSWSTWRTASCTGTDGTTDPQTITALSVAFTHDSTTTQPNRIKFRISNMGGTEAESPAFSLNIDTTPPINPTLTPDRDTNTWSEDANITITWSGASDGASGIENYFYQWSTSPTTVPDESLSTPLTSLSTTIPAEGNSNYFHLITVDSAGNRAISAVHLGAFFFDTGPPEIISGPTVSSLTQYLAAVSWQTSEDSDSVVHYSNTAGRYSLQETDATLVTDHSVSLTSLTPSTTYRLMVQSTDSSGKGVESHEVTFETLALADDTNPTVYLIDPGVCRGTVTIAANASDDRGVECVVFSLDGDIIGIDYAAPYQILWDTEKLINKDYTITAKAIDFSGKSSVDDMKKFVDNFKDMLPPTVEIISPEDGDTVSGEIKVMAYVEDDDPGWPYVEWAVDGKRVGGRQFNSKDIEFSWDTRFWENNTMHTLEITTTHGGKTGSDTVNVYIDNLGDPLRPKLVISNYNYTRNNNYFDVSLQVENCGDALANNIEIWFPFNSFQLVSGEDNGSFVNYKGELNKSNMEGGCTINDSVNLLPGKTHDYTFSVVPVLLHPDSLQPSIGDNIIVGCKGPSGKDYIDFFVVVDSQLKNDFENALKESDYLLVTNPNKLLDHNTYNDVNTLLSDMARLAKDKDGVLGFLNTYSEETLRVLIESQIWFDFAGYTVGAWTDKLSQKFNSNLGGYLLIVGETEIVPARKELGFNIKWTGGDTTTSVPFSDHPYTDTNHDGLPDLIVGRIIGNTAADLSKAIRSSIYGNSIDLSDVLLVSGVDEDNSIQAQFATNLFNVGDTLCIKSECPYKLKWENTEVDPPNPQLIKQQMVEDFRDKARGKEVIYYSGHGGNFYWDGIAEWNFPVDFGNVNPFVFASSCLTGDYENGGIAEAFFDSGVSVYIGATQVSSIPGNCTAGEWFFNNWDADEDIGTVFTQLERGKWSGKKDYWGLWVWEYNLYGDPKFGKLTTTKGQKEITRAKRQTPTPSLNVEIPDYVVTTRDSLDYVEIPNGDLWLEEGRYQIPFYSNSIDYPRGYRVQGVTLTNRSGLVTDTGLHLPVTIMERGSPGSKANRNATPPAGWFPELGKKYEWKVIENPDKTTTLLIIMYPFYYNGQTTDVEFYKNYSFTVNYTASDVEITSLTTDKDSYPQGDPVQIHMGINNAGDAQDIVVSTIIKPYGSDTIVDSLPLSTLSNLSGYASFSDQWDSTGVAPGYYAVEVTLKDTTGNVLDRKTHMFRLGISSGEVTSLTALPTSFDPGDSIALSMDFQNTGTIPITGTAIMKVKDQSGNSLKEFKHPVTNLAATNSITFDDTWDTTTVPGALYTIIGYVLFDSKSSEVMTTTVSSLSDGDVAPLGNRDGLVNVGDALVALRFALGLETPTPEDIAHGDVAPLDEENKPNPDGVINVGDALVILRKALGIVVF
jgi:hypothetical protein